jgi:hypothetical protein
MPLRVGPSQDNAPSFVEYQDLPAEKKPEQVVVTEAWLLAELKRRGWTLTTDEDGRQMLTEPIRDL